MTFFGDYLAIGSGVALIGASFAFANAADESYQQYLSETDPAQIETLYDQTTRLDWAARGSLIGGEVLLAGGLYLRFIRRPHGGGVALIVTPQRCALSLRF